MRKRLQSAAVSLLTILLLAGCGAEAKMPVEDHPAVPKEDPPPVASEWSYRVEIQEYDRTTQTEDGTVLVKVQAQIPEMSVVDAEGHLLPREEISEEAQTVVKTFNEQFSGWTSEEDLDDLTKTAKEDLTWAQEAGEQWLGPYTRELTTSIYQTDQLISVAGRVASYTGGAHPNTARVSWNFDLEHGQPFTGKSICSSEDTKFKTAVSEELIRQAQAITWDQDTTTEEMFWPDYESILQDWDSYTVYFDETGMTVAFSPYELGCYAAGEQIFHLSYDWITDHIPCPNGCRVLDLPVPEMEESDSDSH